MAPTTPIAHPIQRIVVRLRVGDDRMAASDDPLFLGLRGEGGREFRLLLAKGSSLRRGAEDVYVLSGADAGDCNVARPELNDPTQPALDLDRVRSVFLRKGLEPIPNVRGHGEMDDRLHLEEAEVEIHAEGQPKPRLYGCTGPIWLGLVCGLTTELASLSEEA